MAVAVGPFRGDLGGAAVGRIVRVPGPRGRASSGVLRGFVRSPLPPGEGTGREDGARVPRRNEPTGGAGVWVSNTRAHLLQSRAGPGRCARKRPGGQIGRASGRERGETARAPEY